MYPNCISLEKRKTVLSDGIHYIYSIFVNFFEILNYSWVGFFFLKHPVEVSVNVEVPKVSVNGDASLFL